MGARASVAASARGVQRVIQDLTIGQQLRHQRFDIVVDFHGGPRGSFLTWASGAKIRLENIDTPETHEPRCASEAARGRRATRRLLELINAGPFQLVRTGGRDEDRYGRKLRTITRNGRSVGDVLIAEGLARPWDGARRSWCG